MKSSGGIKIIIVGVILAAIVVVYFYYTANKVDEIREENVQSTQVQTVLLRDLDKNYPPSPKEVVKIQGLYDNELIANKSQEDYLKDLKSDIAEMKMNDRSISSYQVSASTDVEFFTQDGDSCARLYCTYGIRQGTEILQSSVVFILRQDEAKHWKILGWAEDD